MFWISNCLVNICWRYEWVISEYHIYHVANAFTALCFPLVLRTTLQNITRLVLKKMKLRSEEVKELAQSYTKYIYSIYNIV